MISITLYRLPWLLLILLSTLLGVVSTFSINGGSFTAIVVGTVITTWVWFASRPFVWWYDLVFFSVLLCVAVSAALTTGLLCWLLAQAFLTTHVCRDYRFVTSFGATLCILLIPSGLAWGWTRIAHMLPSRHH